MVYAFFVKTTYPLSPELLRVESCQFAKVQTFLASAAAALVTRKMMKSVSKV